MFGNPLRRLHSFGQSLWLDLVSRQLLRSGQLKRLIDKDGLRGLTSNPTIFDQAIGGSHDYDDSIRELSQAGKSGADIYQALVIEDLRGAADLLRPTYDREDGRDGFVSMEVSPHLVHDTGGTIAEAQDDWQALDRPNAMIKIPATEEGLAAIRQLTREGININVTLLFGLPRYRQVLDAYMAGLEDRVAQGQPLDHIASVASFFLSRIDVLLDPQLEKLMIGDGPRAELARRLHGQVAIASAKVAYQVFQEISGSERWRKLADKGARPQRLLWASTGTKNPSYSDVKYIEPLIGPDTVNTMPMETIDAYRDHGRPQMTLESDVLAAREVLESLPQVGIDLRHATQQLEDEGAQKFIASFDHLAQTIEERRAGVMAHS